MQVTIKFKGLVLTCVGTYEPEERSYEHWAPASWQTTEVWLGDYNITDLVEDKLLEIDELCLAEV